jgi:hypothetical protein
MSMVSACCLDAPYMGLTCRIWLVLRLCQWRMLESDECLRYIFEHGDMDVFVDVVLVNIHSKIVCAIPVLGAFVVFIQDDGEVLSMFAASVFDAEVVSLECEGDRAKIVLP